MYSKFRSLLRKCFRACLLLFVCPRSSRGGEHALTEALKQIILIAEHRSHARQRQLALGTFSASHRATAGAGRMTRGDANTWVTELFNCFLHEAELTRMSRQESLADVRCTFLLISHLTGSALETHSAAHPRHRGGCKMKKRA